MKEQIEEKTELSNGEKIEILKTWDWDKIDDFLTQGDLTHLGRNYLHLLRPDQKAKFVLKYKKDNDLIWNNLLELLTERNIEIHAERKEVL